MKDEVDGRRCWVGIRVQAWGRYARVSWRGITASNLFSSLPLYGAYLFRSRRVYSVTYQVYIHKRIYIWESCESRCKDDRKKKWTRQEEMGGLGKCALYTAGARCWQFNKRASDNELTWKMETHTEYERGNEQVKTVCGYWSASTICKFCYLHRKRVETGCQRKGAESGWLFLSWQLTLVCMWSVCGVCSACPIVCVRVLQPYS